MNRNYLSCITFFALVVLFHCSYAIAQQPRLRGFTVNDPLLEQDYDDLATWNANIVRYHIQWNEDANVASAEEYVDWLDSVLSKVDDVVTWCGDRNIKVILNLHSPPGGFKSIEYPSLQRMFVEPKHLQAFFESWKKIATRYKDNTAIWGYDILNEPAIRSSTTGIRSWESIAKETAEIISKIDPKKKIIVEPAYGDQARLSSIRNLKFPNLVISPHLYYPLKFHQQGIYGNPTGIAYPTKKVTRSALLKNVRTLIKFQQRTKNKVPIYIGEFTANRFAPGQSAYYYLRDIIGIMERFKWSWTYHGFREADPWDLEKDGPYGSKRKSAGATMREVLVRRFLDKNR